MMFAQFKAVCDLELGDKVLFDGKITTIYDIQSIHMLKSGQVYFWFKIGGEFGIWVNRNQITHPVKL